MITLSHSSIRLLNRNRIIVTVYDGGARSTARGMNPFGEGSPSRRRASLQSCATPMPLRLGQ